MTKIAFDARQVREALARLPDVAAQESLEPPALQHLYLPIGHQQALGLDAGIVVGMRGAGKSVWTAVLSSNFHRAFIATLADNKALASAKVRVGFGLDSSNTHFPSEQVIASIVQSGVDPFAIWHTVVLRHAETALGKPDRFSGEWLAAARAVAARPQDAEAALTECDRELAAKGAVLLVLFDALERVAQDWPRVRLLLSGALRFALACRTRQSIRMKFFLRPEMEEDSEIWKFADSSKLKHGRVELTWRTTDLYALVLTHLLNDTNAGTHFQMKLLELPGIQWLTAEFFERILMSFFRAAGFAGPEGARLDLVRPLPRSLVDNEGLLQAVVEGITGPFMGRNRRRGLSYSWIPTHLADAAGRVSPRSLLLGFKHAAGITAREYPNHELPLRYEAIQRGIVEASRVRVDEIKEDYPWVWPLLEAARGLKVPCTAAELTERWTPAQIREMRSTSAKLPPRRFTTDPIRTGQPDALIDDLVELAILYRTSDNRLNMPDIFRVGFGIKRKGGVKPPR